MGGSSWSDDLYTARKSIRAATNAPTFAHNAAIDSGAIAAKAHDSLDPKKMKGGIREARDSAEHPNSNPVYIGLDVTGSMARVPSDVQAKLKEFMGLLLTKGYLEDPAICVSAIGDAAYDTTPLQVGQFESGIEIENDITNMYLEGGGGGNNIESYDLALYFLARCVKTDAWEKRQKKGYAFIICDEALKDSCSASQIKAVFGSSPEGDITTSTLLSEILEKWELYCIVPGMTHNYKTRLQDSWKKVLGERVIFQDDPSTIVETIASIIGVLEDAADHASLTTDLQAVSGLSTGQAEAVTRALAKVTPGASLGTSLTRI